MLKVQQLSVSYNEDKSIKYSRILDAFCFERGASDLTEKFTSKIGKDNTPFEYIVATEKTADGKPLVTSEDPQKLLADAINSATTWFPKENPILAILTAFSTRVNLEVKSAAKPFDLEAAVTKLKKFLSDSSGLSAEDVDAQIAAYKTSMQAKQKAA